MSTRIADLASIVSFNTLKFNEYLEQKHLPTPSFDVNGPIDLNIGPADVRLSRSKAIDALQELLDLLRGPVMCMVPDWNSTSLQVICRYEIAQKVPLEESISFEELATKCRLHVVDLKRIVRYAITFHHVFCEPKPGFVAHSAGSKLLVRDDIVRAGVAQTCEEWIPSFVRTADALEKFDDQEPNHTGFALAHDTEGNMYNYLDSRPVKADQFAKAMMFTSRNQVGWSVSYLVEGYDWKSISKGTVVDVGGSEGHVSIALADAYPDLTIIVQDLPKVIDAMDTVSNTHTASGRLTFQAHDMFTPQPIVADVYLFRAVLHNWPDHYVERALKCLIPTLRTRSRIIVNETLSPEIAQQPLSFQRRARYVDMVMLTVGNARQRTLDEWQQIFWKADSRFSKIQCVKPEGASLAIMEVVWEG